MKNAGQGRCASAALLLQASVCVGLQPSAWGFSAVHSSGVVAPPCSPSALPSHQTSRSTSLWCCSLEVDSDDQQAHIRAPVRALNCKSTHSCQPCEVAACSLPLCSGAKTRARVQGGAASFRVVAWCIAWCMARSRRSPHGWVLRVPTAKTPAGLPAGGRGAFRAGTNGQQRIRQPCVRALCPHPPPTRTPTRTQTRTTGRHPRNRTCYLVQPA